MTPNLLDELEGVVAKIRATTDPTAADDAATFIETHHAALADMAKRLEAAERKAARYDYLSRRIYVEDHDGGWSSSYMFLPIPRRDDSTYNDAKPYNFVALDDAIDAAIDATQEGEG